MDHNDRPHEDPHVGFTDPAREAAAPWGDGAVDSRQAPAAGSGPSGSPRPWPALIALLVLSIVAGGGIGLVASWPRQPAVPATAVPPPSQPVVEVQPVSPQDVWAGAAGGAAGAVVADGLPGTLVHAEASVAAGVTGGVTAGAVTAGTGGATSAAAAGGGLGGALGTGGREGTGLRPPVAEPEQPGADRGRAVGTSPRLAIIIDDWGYDWAAADAFLSFPEPITVAVLPFLPRSTDQALRAQKAGFEVILHMPMEAQDASLDIGPGGVYVSMADEEVAAAVRAALAAVPGAIGLNNHMGSRATTDRRVMRAVLEVLAERNLFFVDSYTIAGTVAHQVAREMQVPYAVNRVFLDSVDDEAAIRQQIRRLINLALRDGAAVGIGHVRPRTYTALMDMLPEIRAAGVQLVPVSQVLTRPLALASDRERSAGGAPAASVAGTAPSPPAAPAAAPEPAAGAMGAPEAGRGTSAGAAGAAPGANPAPEPPFVPAAAAPTAPADDASEVLDDGAPEAPENSVLDEAANGAPDVPGDGAPDVAGDGVPENPENGPPHARDPDATHAPDDDEAPAPGDDDARAPEDAAGDAPGLEPAPDPGPAEDEAPAPVR